MKRIFFTILSVLFGLQFINAGLNKFFNYIPVPDEIPEEMLKDFQAITEIVWLMPLIGITEILGGILVIIPKTRVLGALVLFPVMIGILCTHIFVDTTALTLVLVYLVILLWILYESRGKLKALF